MLTRLLLPVVAMLVLLSLVVAPAEATSRTAPSVLIGDSIGHGVAAQLRAARPNLVVDAVPGRRVVSLPARVERYLERYGVPSTLVIELGTNTVAGWTKADYQTVVDLVPSTTKVVLVTPYVRRNDLPASWPRGSRAATRTAKYATWERELATSNSNVCVADWRAEVSAHQDWLTAGGVHPNAAGKAAFVHLVTTTLATCDG